MTKSALKLDDCPPELQKKLMLAAGVKETRQNQFSIEDVRSNAFKVMLTVASLMSSQRERVLKHCLKVNKV